MSKRKEHRNYSGCPIACALDIFGDHWTLLIIRNLMFLGVHEYKDMLKLEEGISTNILSDRLALLEREEIISSIPHETNLKRKIYYLTDRGKSLVHIMTSIVYWSKDNLNDYLDIPADKAEALSLGPSKFAEIIIRQLEDWEQQNL